MKAYAKKRWDNSLAPLDQYSLEVFQKIKLDKEVEIEIIQKRNVGFHKKFFVLIHLIFEIQSCFNSIDMFRNWIIMKAGYVDQCKTPGGVMYMAKSIKFSSMKQLEFEQLYSDVINVALLHENICGGIEKEDLLKEYESKILSFS